jgi:hypothetical protein
VHHYRIPCYLSFSLPPFHLPDAMSSNNTITYDPIDRFAFEDDPSIPDPAEGGEFGGRGGQSCDEYRSDCSGSYEGSRNNHENELDNDDLVEDLVSALETGEVLENNWQQTTNEKNSVGLGEDFSVDLDDPFGEGQSNGDDSVDVEGDLQYECSNVKTFFDEELELLDESNSVDSDVDTGHNSPVSCEYWRLLGC